MMKSGLLDSSALANLQASNLNKMSLATLTTQSN